MNQTHKRGMQAANGSNLISEPVKKNSQTHTGTGAGSGIQFNAIGWTSADGVQAPRRTAWGILPPVSADSLTIRQAGDITGNFKASTGAGAGRRKWQGEGRDIEAERAEHLAEFTERLPDLVADLHAEQDFGKRLLRLGKRAADKAARHVYRQRAVECSASSIDEAASEATQAALFEAWNLEAILGSVDWSNLHNARQLGLTAWRAAYRSLTSRQDGIRARRGKQGTADAPPVSVPLSGAELQVAAASLQAWASGTQTAEESALQVAQETMEARARADKRRASGWIWDALVTDQARQMSASYRRASSGQAKLKAARARAVLLIRLIWGATMADAARLAGFSSPRSAAESLRSGKVREILTRAAMANADKLPGLARLRDAARAAGLEAGARVREARRLASVAGARGVAGTVQTESRTRRNGRLNHGAASIETESTARPAIISNPLQGDYSRAVDARAQAVEWARFSSARFQARRARVAEDFGQVFSGIWSGSASNAKRGPVAGYAASGTGAATRSMGR